MPEDMRDELVKWLAPVEIAYITGFNIRTVLKWLREGKLQGRKISNQWRVHPDKLKSFIESGFGEEKK